MDSLLMFLLNLALCNGLAQSYSCFCLSESRTQRCQLHSCHACHARLGLRVRTLNMIMMLHHDGQTRINGFKLDSSWIGPWPLSRSPAARRAILHSHGTSHFGWPDSVTLHWTRKQLELEADSVRDSLNLTWYLLACPLGGVPPGQYPRALSWDKIHGGFQNLILQRRFNVIMAVSPLHWHGQLGQQREEQGNVFIFSLALRLQTWVTVTVLPGY